ncbi:PREDICTED: B-box zinc finger protein 20-like [Fragaria vesca subsp. vesca]|uniref:B-box zinc finger protein 20-like n=1 Tax=Fragaria vesca subsp. vesca TaxID=101020 RepID=UPI0002C2F83B|nr:PREDICTED: B-box zinc finger protein 20-like [Fragaria vesca subsp. vesca]
MKIRCNFCDKAEATVFCSADEAALCDVCDRRVHHANKLASKHKRFFLLQPTCKDSPQCDICQERRGFLFCQEDRAIFCRECDNSIHKANEHTRKHNRFLLTGVKLSADSTQYPPSSSSCSFSNEVVITNSTDHARVASKSSTKRPRTGSNEQTSSYKVEENCSLSDNGSVSSTNSISEYLMGDQITEWRVEDLLDVSFDFDSFYEAKSAPYI